MADPQLPALSEEPTSGAFLPYPTSTLAPKIVPNDLTSFKTRGLTQVERDMQQKLVELREAYVAAIEHFNWNKLVYEADIRFEPIVGEIYHLYKLSAGYSLSMVDPETWNQPYLGSFRLNIDRQWQLETVGDVDPTALFAELAAANA